MLFPLVAAPALAPDRTATVALPEPHAPGTQGCTPAILGQASREPVASRWRTPALKPWDVLMGFLRTVTAWNPVTHCRQDIGVPFCRRVKHREPSKHVEGVQPPSQNPYVLGRNHPGRFVQQLVGPPPRLSLLPRDCHLQSYRAVSAAELAGPGRSCLNGYFPE